MAISCSNVSHAETIQEEKSSAEQSKGDAKGNGAVCLKLDVILILKFRFGPDSDLIMGKYLWNSEGIC